MLIAVFVLLTLPAAGYYLGWGDKLAGFIAGVASSNTAQCIAIGYAYSESAGATATIVKPVRNTLMPVFIILLTYLYIRRGLPVGKQIKLKLLWDNFPKFIVGLIVAASLNTFGLLSTETVTIAGKLSSWLFVICFVGIGAGIDIKEIGKKDLVVMALGLIMIIMLGIYAYLYSSYVLFL